MEKEADEIEKNEIVFLAMEEGILFRCLEITKVLLQTTHNDLRDHGIAGLLHTVILPAVQNIHPVIRNTAVQCLGLYCLMDEVSTEKKKQK